MTSLVGSKKSSGPAGRELFGSFNEHLNVASDEICVCATGKNLKAFIRGNLSNWRKFADYAQTSEGLAR